MNTVEWLDWHGCYDANWNGYIVPEAFAHPAKFARGLVERIYRHMLERGWIKKGDTIFDPFGGVANGGIIGASLGLRWIGVELEERFVGFARRNIELHRRLWETMGDPLPVILQGDSRQAAALVRAAAVVTSPPYANSMESGDGLAHIDFSKCTDRRRIRKPSTGTQGQRSESYGSTPGQLGSMKEGDVDSIVGSPPYAETPITGQGNFQSAKCPASQPARDARE